MINEVAIKKIISQLPPADKVYTWQGVTWEIYLAKNFFVSEWENEATHAMVLECRKSFKRYGEIRLIDDFDNKSLVLLTRVCFERNGVSQEEFFSLRLIPAQGEPFLTEDLKITFFDGRSLHEIIKEKLFFNQSKIEENLFTISRFCGFSLGDRIDVNNTCSQKLKFTTISFVLMWRLALENLSHLKKNIYFTAMFNQDMFNKLSKYKIDNQETVLFLPEISEIIAMAVENFKNFSPGPVAFHYPTYFFHLSELFFWLKKILSEKKISMNTVKHFLQQEIDLEQVEGHLSSNKIAVIEKLCWLGKMLNTSEALPGSDLSSAQLRADLEKSVSRPLVLKIVGLNDLESRLKKFLNDLGF
jgi:hypothetical protein